MTPRSLSQTRLLVVSAPRPLARSRLLVIPTPRSFSRLRIISTSGSLSHRWYIIPALRPFANRLIIVTALRSFAWFGLFRWSVIMASRPLTRFTSWFTAATWCR